MRQLRPWTLAAAFATGALLVAFMRPAPAPAAFEYAVVRYTGVDLTAEPKRQDEQVAALQAQINGYAKDGWELAFVQGGFAILKR